MATWKKVLTEADKATDGAGGIANGETGLATGKYSNAAVYSPTFGSGIYQHDKIYQKAWGSAFYTCYVLGNRATADHIFKSKPFD